MKAAKSTPGSCGVHGCGLGLWGGGWGFWGAWIVWGGRLVSGLCRLGFLVFSGSAGGLGVHDGVLKVCSSWWRSSGSVSSCACVLSFWLSTVICRPLLCIPGRSSLCLLGFRALWGLLPCASTSKCSCLAGVLGFMPWAHIHYRAMCRLGEMNCYNELHSQTLNMQVRYTDYTLIRSYYFVSLSKKK